MDNPYQPPNAPLTAQPADRPVERSVIIETPKGPVRLEQRGETITLVLGILRKDIPVTKFVSWIPLIFFRTKRIGFKPIGLYRIVVSEKKFREVLDFYGIERFKHYDIRSMRWIYAAIGLLFLINAALDWKTLVRLPLFALTIAGVLSLCFSLFALTFTRRYLAHLYFSTFVCFVVVAQLVFRWYLHDDWWMIVLCLVMSFVISANLARIRYFRKTANPNQSG